MPTNTATSIDNDATNGLEISFCVAAGSNFTTGSLGTSWATTATSSRYAGQAANIMSSTDNEWYITGIQMEVGSVATPFEHRSFGEELALCQRYYYRRVTDTSSQYLCDAFTTSSTQIVGLVQFPVEMRAAPTQAGEDLEDAVFRHDGGTNAFDSFSGIAGVPSKSGTAAFITTSGLSANKSGFIRHHDGAVGLNFDAEL